MEKKTPQNELEFLQTLQDVIFDLNETKTSQSVQTISDIFDGDYPLSMNIIICQMLYLSFVINRFEFSVCLDFLKEISSFEETNKIKSNIFDVFTFILLEKNSQESFYLLDNLIKQNIIEQNIIKYKKDLYFLHYKSDNDMNELKTFKYYSDISNGLDKLKKDDWKLHQELIQEGVNPLNVTRAIRYDEIEKLQEITSQSNFDFNQIIKGSFYERCSFINWGNITLIDYAAYYGSVKCFKYLLMHGANIENTGKYAIAGGNIEIIHLCIQNHSTFEEAYAIAIAFHRNDIFKYFYENKIIEIANLDKLGQQCILYQNYEIFAYLIKENLIINNDIIYTSTQNGNIFLIKYFHGYQIPNDILVYSAVSGNIELVKYFLEKGFDVNMKDKNGWTALMMASFHGHTELVKLLLEQKGIDINAKDSWNGNTALMFATIREKNDVVKLLLNQKGVNINDKNNDGTSLLIFASDGNLNLVKLLLDQKGIDINAKNKVGYTALHVAASRGNLKIVQLLLEQKGISINDKGIDGETPLICAAKMGHVEIVKLLLEQEGIDINAKNSRGQTALTRASSRGLTEVVDLIRKKTDEAK